MNNESGESDETASDEPELPATIHTLLERVQEQARERPLTTLAVAGGIGFVLARGLPRLGGMMVLGVGGLAGYAIMRMRRAGATSDGGVPTDELADTSDDAHDIHVSSSAPDPTRPRRGPKKPDIVGGA